MDVTRDTLPRTADLLLDKDAASAGNSVFARLQATR